MDQNSTLEMTIDLNVLNHLGIRLYSNTPAVLSEIVANAWDADATNINITIDKDNSTIVIMDDGHGMTREEVQNLYLQVGHDRRSAGRKFTPNNRPVMGRKGIGKLSAFSIAKTVEIHTFKNGEQTAFEMDRDDMQEQIKNGSASYIPKEIDCIQKTNGTIVVLTELDKSIKTTATFLKRRLAGRFSVIGTQDFQVKINNEAITAKDRNYYNKLEYLWVFDEESKNEAMRYGEFQKDGSLENTFTYQYGQGDLFEQSEQAIIKGWIASVQSRSSNTDGETGIVVFANGKLVHENILREFDDGGFYRHYLVGEINADFLDDNDKPDIITSSRQSVQENDIRFKELKEHIKIQLRKINLDWSKWRGEKATVNALKKPSLKKWYDDMPKGRRQYAQKLFKRIETLGVADESAKFELYRSSIIAFEKLALHSALEELDGIKTTQDFKVLQLLFKHVDDLEDALYKDKITSRLKVISKLDGLSDNNKKESLFQELIFDHLWLIDPTWEHDPTLVRKEGSVKTMLDELSDRATDEERNGRIDIFYRVRRSGHVIVELKRASVKTDPYTLMKQANKYKSAAKKTLQDKFNIPNPHIDVVFLLGARPTFEDSDEELNKLLNVQSMRYLTYEEISQKAKAAHSTFIEASTESDRIKNILESLSDDFPTKNQS